MSSTEKLPAAAAAAVDETKPGASSSSLTRKEAKSKRKRDRNKRKKSKARIPPYKTYHVVTPSIDGYDIVRPVNQYDVLCVEDAEQQFRVEQQQQETENDNAASNNSSGHLYDYSKQPGNVKYNMLVNLSQANFNKMVTDRNETKHKKDGTTATSKSINNNSGNDSEAEEQDEESKQVLARSIVETIRDDWRGLFLRKADPTQPHGTLWLDIGFCESVEEVEMLFERNTAKLDREKEEQTRREEYEKVKAERDREFRHHGAGDGGMTAAAVPASMKYQHQQLQYILPATLATADVDTTPTVTDTTHMGMQTKTSDGFVPYGASMLPPLPANLAAAQMENSMAQPGVAAAAMTMAMPYDSLEAETDAFAGPNTKRKRGRPRKDDIRPPTIQGPKRKRGRPRKSDAEKLADAVKKQRDGRGRQGRRKLISMPGPRSAPSIVPLGNQAPLDANGTLLLWPAGKRSKTFDFRLEGGDNDSSMEPETPSRTTRIKLVPPPPPSSPPPFPALNRDVEQGSSKVVQARRYVKVKDPDWIVNYDKLLYCRVNLYVNGQPDRWAAGLMRHSVKTAKDKKSGTDMTLNHWIYGQQLMYHNYCEWEDEKFAIAAEPPTALSAWTEEMSNAPEQPLQQSLQQQQQQQQTAISANQQLPKKIQQQIQQNIDEGRHPIVGAGVIPRVLPDSIRLPQLGEGTAAAASNATSDQESGEQQCGEKTSQQPDFQAGKVPAYDSASEAVTGENVHGSGINESPDQADDNDSQELREVQRAKILLLDAINLVWQPNQEPPADAPQDWKESFYDLREYLRSRGDTAVPDTVELGVWAQLQRMQMQRSLAAYSRGGESVSPAQAPRPPLSRGQIAALRALGFDWEDLESSQFHVMFLKLLDFKKRVGDCLVPPPPISFGEDDDDDEDEEEDCIVETKADPNLFLWVQRLRLENIRFQAAKESTEEHTEGVDEAGQALLDELLEEDETAASDPKQDEPDDNDDGTVVADLVKTPARPFRHFLSKMRVAREQKLEVEPDTINTNNISNKGNDNSTGEKKPKPINETAISAAQKKRFHQPARSSDTVSTLTQAQIDLLNATQFIWGADISPKWIMQYRRLHAFFIKHGHTKVTRSTNQSKTKLNRWCSQVRQLHQKRLAGNKFGLTDEKLKLLKRLDFIFEFDDLPERFSFKERFEWLKQYKEENGNCDVPQRNPELGHFVKRLRKEYELHRRGLRAMDPKKIKSLDELNFRWRVRVVRGSRRRTKSIDEIEQEEGEEEEEDDDEEAGGEDDEETEEEDDEDGDDNDDLMKRLKSPADYHINHIQSPVKKGGSDTFACARCRTDILYPDAKCQECPTSYCKRCFDAIQLHDGHPCVKCGATVASMRSYASV